LRNSIQGSITKTRPQENADAGMKDQKLWGITQTLSKIKLRKTDVFLMARAFGRANFMYAR